MKIKNKTNEVRKFREAKKSDWTYLKPGESIHINNLPIEGFNESVFEIIQEAPLPLEEDEESGKGEKRRRVTKNEKKNKKEDLI